MAYAQQTAKRAVQTVLYVGTGAWVACEASTGAITNRNTVKVFNSGTGGASRIALSYDNTIDISKAAHWLGAGQFVVEPASAGLTLYARAKLASGVNSIRIVVTEYSE